MTGQKEEEKEKEKEERKILRVDGGLVDNPKVVQEVLVDLKRNVTQRRCLIPNFFPNDLDHSHGAACCKQDVTMVQYVK